LKTLLRVFIKCKDEKGVEKEKYLCRKKFFEPRRRDRISFQ